MIPDSFVTEELWPRADAWGIPREEFERAFEAEVARYDEEATRDRVEV